MLSKIRETMVHFINQGAEFRMNEMNPEPEISVSARAHPQP